MITEHPVYRNPCRKWKQRRKDEMGRSIHIKNLQILQTNDRKRSPHVCRQASQEKRERERGGSINKTTGRKENGGLLFLSFFLLKAVPREREHVLSVPSLGGRVLFRIGALTNIVHKQEMLLFHSPLLILCLFRLCPLSLFHLPLVFYVFVCVMFS